MPDDEILLGDIGIVLGQQGLWSVYAGAHPPANVVPCSAAAKAAAEDDGVLTVVGQGVLRVPRDQFIPSHRASIEQQIDAGIR